MSGLLIQYDQCPYNKMAMKTQGEDHVMTKTEIGIMLPQAKEHQRLPANHLKLGEREGRMPYRF